MKEEREEAIRESKRLLHTKQKQKRIKAVPRSRNDDFNIPPLLRMIKEQQTTGLGHFICFFVFFKEILFI